jgi:serine protease Do
VLAKDSEGTQPSTVFEPTDTVYAIVTLSNAPDDTTLKAIWTAVNVGSAAEPNQLIDEVSLTAGSGTHYFNLTPGSPFPAGEYKVDIFMNDELAQSLPFQVAGEVAVPVATEAAAAPGGAVSSLDNVNQATVRITTQGSFSDPEFGDMLNAAGQGTGFIVDPSGVAVTNNHVVTGAAFLEVWLEGEDAPRNARVLGVSECSDLAVIDIDGDGLPYLEWYEGPIEVGQDVYVAGFPLFGNEEYTLTRGIISKAEADGETSWASVDNVLEVDAVINGGNSGGPLVDPNGRVIGINYASAYESRLGYSISRDEAQSVLESLRAGENVNSIGVNGQAVMSEDGSIAGIWVSSVDSGSPADVAGVEPGDIITKLEGLVLATDGTMADYCDILRSRSAEDVMSIEVLRFASGEILEGQLNGSPLETTVAIDTGSDVVEGEAYESYEVVTDDTETLQVEVPTAWSDLSGGGWIENGEELGPGLIASTSVDGFTGDWSTPGVFFGSTSQLGADPIAVLDSYDLSDQCTFDSRVDYEDALYTGAYDIWSGCGGGNTAFVILSAVPEDASFVALLQVQIVSTADEEALNRILNSFIVLQ